MEQQPGLRFSGTTQACPLSGHPGTQARRDRAVTQGSQVVPVVRERQGIPASPVLRVGRVGSLGLVVNREQLEQRESVGFRASAASVAQVRQDIPGSVALARVGLVASQVPIPVPVGTVATLARQAMREQVGSPVSLAVAQAVSAGSRAAWEPVDSVVSLVDPDTRDSQALEHRDLAASQGLELAASQVSPGLD